MKIAILGAWCTGKTELTRALMREQTRDINTTGQPAFQVEDATSLMNAVYLDLQFKDSTGYAHALKQHLDNDLTLVMGLDLLHIANDEKRQEPFSREVIDSRLRQVLHENGVRYTVIYGHGSDRLQSVRQAIAHHLFTSMPRTPRHVLAWQWACEKCSDPACEHLLFTGALGIGKRPEC